MTAPGRGRIEDDPSREPRASRRFVAIAAGVAVVVLGAAAVVAVVARDASIESINAVPEPRSCSADPLIAMNRVAGYPGSADVVTVRADRSEQVLTGERLGTGEWVATNPDFSPDGDHLAVARAVGSYESAGPEGVDVWTVPLDDPAHPRQLTRDEYVIGGPDWSPTGDMLLYSVLDVSDRSSRLRVVPVSDGDAATLVESSPDVYLEEPRWSPDGTRVAFLREPAISTGIARPVELWIAGADGAGARRVADVPDAAWISWDPHGHRLLVSTFAGEDGKVFSIDLDSGESRIVAAGATLARYGPDGVSIYYFTKQGAPTSEGWQLARGQLGGGQLRQVELVDVPEEYLYGYYGMDPAPCHRAK